MPDGLRCLGNSSLGLYRNHSGLDWVFHIRHFVHTFFLKPSFLAHPARFEVFPFTIITKNAPLAVRVGLYAVPIVNTGRDLANNPIAFYHEADPMGIGYSNPLSWVKGITSGFPNNVETDRDSVSLADVPRILVRHFEQMSETTTKLQKRMASHALVLFTVEGLPDVYLGTNTLTKVTIPAHLTFFLSVAVDNPNYDPDSFLGGSREVVVAKWDRITEVKSSS